MAFSWIRLGVAIVLSVGAVAPFGCAAHPDAVEEQELGTVTLPLVTPTRGTYRLSNATFAIASQSGTPVITLDSESDPDAAALSAQLTQGSYSVRLGDGWVLSSVAADGTEAPVNAALVTRNPQSFEIRSGVDTNLAFTFTTDAGVVVIGDGSVNISVDVTTNAPLTACEVTGYGCPYGQTCLLANATGGTFCASPGSLPVGSPCTSEQCVAGAQCLHLDPSAPDQGVCTQFCNTSYSSPFGCNCVSLGFDNSTAGICGPPPAGACDLLAQTGCAAGEACQYLGGGFGTCGVPGPTPVGSACSGETCVAGAQCYGGLCRTFCDTNAPYDPSCFCIGAGTGTVGRCY